MRGTPVFVSMFYGTCTGVCPAVIEDLERLEASLPDAERARARFLLVTLDPERDTPEQLASFAQRKGLDLQRWTRSSGASRSSSRGTPTDSAGPPRPSCRP